MFEVLNNMKRLHISHNDLDGVGCGILIKKFLPGKTDTVYLSYDEIDPLLNSDLDRYDEVIITDVSPSYKSVAKVISEKELLIIDHHLSSESLKDFPNVYHDINFCATMLTYKYLEDNGYPVEEYKELAEAINDIDLWHMKRKDSLEMGVLFNVLGISRFESRFLKSPYNGFNELETTVIELETERKETYMFKAMKRLNSYVDKSGKSVAVVFAEAYASELGNKIIVDNAIDYVVIINAQAKRVSLRSAPHIDVRLLAEKFGGGGHKNASGFQLKDKSVDIEKILTSMEII